MTAYGSPTHCELKSCRKRLVQPKPITNGPKRFCSRRCRKLAWDTKRLGRKPWVVGRPPSTPKERNERQKMCGIPWSKKKRWRKTPPQEFTEMNLCYFMGLLSAIISTDEVHRARGLWRLEKVYEKVYDNKEDVENRVLLSFSEHYTGKVLPDLNSDKLAEYAHKLGDQFYVEWHATHRRKNMKCMFCNPEEQRKAVKGGARRRLRLRLAA